MARNLRDRAAEAGGPEVELLAYPDAGHWGFGASENLHRSDSDGLGKMGGTGAADIAARRDQWPKMLAFLERALGRRGR